MPRRKEGREERVEAQAKEGKEEASCRTRLQFPMSQVDNVNGQASAQLLEL